MTVLLLGGPPASGKSTLLRRMELKGVMSVGLDDAAMAYYRRDDAVSALREFQERDGKEDFILFLTALVTRIAAHHGGVVLEGLFEDPLTRSILAREFHARGCSVGMLWLHASRETILSRNAVREAHIPEHSVNAALPRIIPPVLDEGFDTLRTVSTENWDGLTKAESLAMGMTAGTVAEDTSAADMEWAESVRSWMIMQCFDVSAMRWESMSFMEKTTWMGFFEAAKGYSYGAGIPPHPDDRRRSERRWRVDADGISVK